MRFRKVWINTPMTVGGELYGGPVGKITLNVERGMSHDPGRGERKYRGPVEVEVVGEFIVKAGQEDWRTETKKNTGVSILGEKAVVTFTADEASIARDGGNEKFAWYRIQAKNGDCQDLLSDPQAR